MIRLHVAEIVIAFVFIAGGLSTLRNPQARVEEIARLRFPLPELAVRINAALMIGAGTALALNIQAALASVVLATLLVPTTVFGHAFWLERASGDSCRCRISSRTWRSSAGSCSSR
jgi:Predicted membrane protein